MSLHTLLHPNSIMVIGASKNEAKPGGRLLINLIESHYQGDIYPINPKEIEIRGYRCYPGINEAPPSDLAILCLPAAASVELAEILVESRKTLNLILIAGGFKESGVDGLALQRRLEKLASQPGVTIIGPNCIGFINEVAKAVFVSPIPSVHKTGCDFVSASGAFAVFIFEGALRQGIRFSSVLSVGNAVQTGVEEVLAYWDESYLPKVSSRVKLVYAEEIRNPQKFLKHASSLTQKGCFVIALKTGRSQEGLRAAMSHTGSMAAADAFVDALFRKAGVIRCQSRDEFINTAAVCLQPLPLGKRFLIITNAGGPGVMLTDALTENQIQLPEPTSEQTAGIASIVPKGASCGNPVDMLATGNHQQLSNLLRYVDEHMPQIDAVAVIYGYTGLEDLSETFNAFHQTVNKLQKPGYFILPNKHCASAELGRYTSLGHIVFFDESRFARSLLNVLNLKHIIRNDGTAGSEALPKATGHVLPQSEVKELCRKYNIPMAASYRLSNVAAITDLIQQEPFPWVMKVDGIVHKTEHGGVVLGVSSTEDAFSAFHTLSQLKGATGVWIQPQIKGFELLIGAKRAPKYGHLLMVGWGGIYVELMKDIVSTLVPVDESEASEIIQRLKCYPLIKGYRGKSGLDEALLAKVINSISDMLIEHPEITELDINPLIGNGKQLVAVDIRIIVD